MEAKPKPGWNTSQGRVDRALEAQAARQEVPAQDPDPESDPETDSEIVTSSSSEEDAPPTPVFHPTPVHWAPPPQRGPGLLGHTQLGAAFIWLSACWVLCRPTSVE